MTDVVVAVDEDERLVAATRAGDHAAFARLVERHQRGLRAHCYRMVGSASEAEDLVQETFLRAWRGRGRFEGRAAFRSWLYRIATNACLDALRRRAHPVISLAGAGGHPAEPGAPAPLEEAAPSESEPDAVVVARETAELAFLATVQHLPARQRAVLILRDAYGWSARDSASLLDTTVAATNSALQRARATMHSWADGGSPGSGPTRAQRAVLRCLVDANEQADGAAVAVLARAAG